MKKIFIAVMAFLSAFLGQRMVVKMTAFVAVYSSEMYAQLPAGAMSAGPSTLDSSYTFFEFNTPTNIAGNRWEPLKVGLREAHIRTKRIYFDTLSQLPASTIPSTATLLWLNNREVRCSPLSGLTLSISNISGLQTSLNTKMAYTDTVGKWMPQGAIYDRSNTNEIQSLSGTGRSFTVSSGGNYTIPRTPWDSITTKPSFASVATSGIYADLTGKPTIPLQFNPSAGTGISVTGSYPNNTISNSGVITESDPVWIASPSFTITNTQTGNWNTAFGWGNHASAGYATASNAIAFTGKTGNISQWTNNSGYLIAEVDGSTSNEIQTLSKSGTTITLSSGGAVDIAPATHTVSRAVNGNTFQPSSTLPAWVFYSIRINCTATIGSTASGIIILQYSTDNGSTWIDVGQIENSPSVALAALLSLNDNKVLQVNGFIPANTIVRLNPTTSGTVTITFIKGQEVY